MLCKHSIRQSIRKKRCQLGPQQLVRHEQQVARLLQQIPALQTLHHIAGYWPNDSEISPIAALKHWQKTGKNIYLPVIREDLHLDFCLWQPGQALIKNRFGIPEPVNTQLRHPTRLDAVLMPLVAFDRHGNRLGMGGGFYDRSFAFRRKQLWHKRPLLIGLAHDFQQLPQLPKEHWDIPLDMIVTNHESLYISQKVGRVC